MTKVHFCRENGPIVVIVLNVDDRMFVCFADRRRNGPGFSAVVPVDVLPATTVAAYRKWGNPISFRDVQKDFPWTGFLRSRAATRLKTVAPPAWHKPEDPEPLS